MKAHYSLLGLIIFIMFAHQTNARQNEFSLRNYQTTNYERSSLDLNFDLNQLLSTYRQMRDPVLWNDEFFHNYLSMNASLGYNELLFSRKHNIKNGFNVAAHSDNSRIQEDQAGISPDYSLYKSSTYSISGSAFRDAEHFYNEALNQFWSYKVMLNFNTSSNYLLDENDTLRNESSGIRIDPLSLSLALGHGFGRIENVEDAVEAVYILEELKQNGVVANELTENQIKSFADKITQLKKRRYFDYRIYQQVVMEEMIQFLKEEKMIMNESIGLYNTVNDYHFLAGINTRPSGQKLSYGLTSIFEIYNRKDRLNETSNTALGTTVGLKVRYEHAIPVNIHWQRNLNTELIFDRESSIGRDNATEFGDPIIKPYNFTSYTDYSIVYYPSTRTSITTKVYASLNLNKMMKFEKRSKLPTLTTGLNITGNYYLSERLRLNALFALRYSKDTEPNDPSSVYQNRDHNAFDQSFKISFNYFIL